MTKEDFDSLFDTRVLSWQHGNIVNDGHHGLYTPVSLMSDRDKLNSDTYFSLSRMFFSFRTEYAPFFMMFTGKRAGDWYFADMSCYEGRGNNFTPRMLMSYLRKHLQNVAYHNHNCYSIRGYTMVHKQAGEDESTMRIVFSLVASNELLNELRQTFHRSITRGSFDVTPYVEIINKYPGELQFWIDASLYGVPSEIHMRNERLKLKRFILPVIMNAGIPVRYMSQSEMQHYLCPFASEVGNFPSYSELEEDKKSLLNTALERFASVYARV